MGKSKRRQVLVTLCAHAGSLELKSYVIDRNNIFSVESTLNPATCRLLVLLLGIGPLVFDVVCCGGRLHSQVHWT